MTFKNKLVLVLPFSMLCILPLYPWPTLPGSGLNLTINLLAYSLMALWGICNEFISKRRQIAQSQVYMLLVLGFVMINLPLLWTSEEYHNEGLYRLIATLTLVVFFCKLIVIPISGYNKRKLYFIITIAALIQAVMCFWQAFSPVSAFEWMHYSPLISNGRTTGTFGHANLAGSFIATGMLCALWLSLTTQTRKRAIFLGSVTSILCTALILTGSITAMLGSTVAVIAYLYIVRARNLRLWIVVIFLAGIILGEGAYLVKPKVLPESNVDTNHSLVAGKSKDGSAQFMSAKAHAARRASFTERVTLLQGTWKMIEDHPLAGNGIGSFERTFPKALNEINVTNPFTTTVTHPHNEIFYVWSEGGLVSLIGLILWMYIWFLPLRSFRRTANSLLNCSARGMISIPLFIHILLEYPFYLSVIHSTLMIFLLWAALPAKVIKKELCNDKKPQANVFVKGTVWVLIFSCGLIFTTTGLISAMKLLKYEYYEKDPLILTSIPNSYSQPERMHFDEAVNDLVQYSKTNKFQWLYRFQETATDWLEIHNDANLINSMMIISTLQNDRLSAEYWRHRGCLSFYYDERFTCGGQ